jgi:hypothetical protein
MKSVLNRPSQQVRRELALGERFLGFSGRSRSTGPPQKPQESCHPAGGSGGRRERITLKLAEEVRPVTNGLKAGAVESAIAAAWPERATRPAPPARPCPSFWPGTTADARSTKSSRCVSRAGAARLTLSRESRHVGRIRRLMCGLTANRTLVLSSPQPADGLSAAASSH